MLCEICKTTEATVHLTQVVDGTIKKLHLCESCAQTSGFDLQGPISITDILLGLGGRREEASPASAERSCPRCHMRRSDFKKSGRFGCAMCYQAFSEDLPPLLKAMHRSDRHVGKVPKSERARIDATRELSRLQKELQDAIAGEHYESAATLRDKILACQNKLEKS